MGELEIKLNYPIQYEISTLCYCPSLQKLKCSEGEEGCPPGLQTHTGSHTHNSGVAKQGSEVKCSEVK